MKYKSHDHPRGWDPLGSRDYHNSSKRLSKESVDPKLIAKQYSLDKLRVKLNPKVLLESPKTQSMLDENNLLSEEI
jgi:hypothetical protein